MRFRKGVKSFISIFDFEVTIAKKVMKKKIGSRSLIQAAINIRIRIQAAKTFSSGSGTLL